VTSRPDIVATPVLLLSNVNDPVLLDDGSVKLKETSLKYLLGIIKLVIVGCFTPIFNIADILPRE
jgi:hypothetical protein